MALQSIDIIINRLLPDNFRGQSKLAVFYIADAVEDKDEELRFEVMFANTVAHHYWLRTRKEDFIAVFSQNDKPLIIRNTIEGFVWTKRKEKN
jgi:RecB family exonuclease